MKKPMRVHYDEEGDLLEISIGTPKNCYADEVEPGVFVRKDEKTDEIKSIGILGFKKRSKDFKDIDLSLPLEISINQCQFIFNFYSNFLKYLRTLITIAINKQVTNKTTNSFTLSAGKLFNILGNNITPKIKKGIIHSSLKSIIF